MNVLSLFDGMSCGQIALNRIGIKPDRYFSSEIKNHAIELTQSHYPKTIQLGDICKINLDLLPRIDLLIGGSPCQDFSRGNAERAGVEGEKSKLFWEYVKIYKYLKQKNKNLKFLLENVVMKTEHQEVINNVFNLNPLFINSDLVSAQMRERLYWTNIGEFSEDFFGRKTSLIKQPENRNIYLQDILTSGYVDRLKSRCLLESDSRPLKTPEKMWHRYFNTGFTTIVFDSPDFDWKKGIRYFNQIELERNQTVPDGYTSRLPRNKAACLLGDGWTVDVICHILSHLRG